MRWWVVLAMLLVGCGGADGDDGSVIDSDSDPTGDHSDHFVDERPPCEHFCVAVQFVCTDDDSCRASCEASSTPPGEEHITCAQKATRCDQTFACWDFLSQ